MTRIWFRGWHAKVVDFEVDVEVVVVYSVVVIVPPPTAAAVVVVLGAIV